MAKVVKQVLNQVQVLFVLSDYDMETTFGYQIEPHSLKVTTTMLSV